VSVGFEEEGDFRVRKVKQAGALTGEMPSRERRKPLRLAELRVERPLVWKSGRGSWRWRGLSGGFFRRESLGGPKIPREQRPRPGLNLRVAKRGTAF